jgi:ubiquinone/menaquinone biosynthesis C-methylase UbiE
MTTRDQKIAAGYDRVSRAYADHFHGELEHKPLDRALLDLFADELRGKGKVVDIGCGPGQIARALHDRGLDAMGLDISSEMVRIAREAAPAIPFVQGSMFELDASDGAWAGITAFYAIVHLDPSELPRVFREMSRVLMPGGLLFLSFHVGEGIIHVAELLGQALDLDFCFFTRATVERALADCGFSVEWSIERSPYAGFEYPSRRAYLLARTGSDKP